MLKINYKGYEISQASNNHVMICKDNEMLFHAQCNKILNEDELKQELELFLKLNKVLKEEGMFNVKNINDLIKADLVEKVESDN